VLAIGEPGRKVRFFDGSSGKDTTRSAASDQLWGVWSHIGPTVILATGGIDGSISIWNVRNETKFPLDIPLDIQWREVVTAAPADSGATLGYRWGAWSGTNNPTFLAAGRDDGIVQLWQINSQTGDFEIHHEAHLAQPTLWGTWADVDGVPVLATGDSAGEVRLFRADQRDSVPYAQRHSGEVWSGAWTTVNGVPVLATCAADGALRFWDGRNGSAWIPEPQLIANSTGTPLTPRCLAWARIGGTPILAIGTDEGPGGTAPPIVALWHSGEKALIAAAELGSEAKRVDWLGWADVDGVPVLASGAHGTFTAPDNVVHLFDFVLERSVRRRSTYRSDESAGADRLNRVAEATALAELLLSRSARPPLAVGLFGEWGEGKSYFLGLMREQVASIAKSQEVFAHKHVRQVCFNAWHYAETDLWASLVAEIFAELARPGDGADVGAQQREQSRLVTEIIAERHLPQRIAAEQDRARQLGDSLKPAEWNSLADEKRSDLISAVAAADDKLVEDGYRALTASRSWLRVARMRTGRVWQALPAWSKWVAGLIVFVAAAFVAISVVRPEVLSRSWAVLSALGSVVVGLLAVWGMAKSHVDETLKTYRELKERVEKVIEGWEQPARRALEVSEANIRALQRELQNITAAGQLAGFISDRVAAGGYRRSLGLMTQIREDFNIMSALLTRAEDQYTRGELTGLDEPDTSGDYLPRIDRIVLYIDDLDRCPPHRVVQLLEAVHLLLAVPLFVLVVAVDPRWLLRAIAVHYREMLNSSGSAKPPGSDKEPEAGEEEYWDSTPAQYLEKIFQVVFTLPAMTTVGYTSLLDAVIGPRADINMREVSTSQADQFQPGSSPEQAAEPASAGETDVAPYVNSGTADEVTETIDLPGPPTIERVDPFALNNDELTVIRLLGPPLITTPRAVKRLANSYGLLAAIGRIKDPTDKTDTLPALILLAALVGFPSLGPTLLTQMHRKKIEQPNSTWKAFLEQLKRTESSTPNEVEAWSVLSGALSDITKHVREAKIALPDDISGWHRWIPLVGRLSFPAGSIVAHLGRGSEDGW
jgi:hypothetical protein